MTWRALTTLSRKAKLYQHEAYFRQAWDDFGRTWGREAGSYAQRIVPVLFKPDAIVGRRVKGCIRFLRNRGFVPVAGRAIQVNRQMGLELWRYQSGGVTLDLLDVAEMVFRAGPSLLVVLRDQTDPLVLPASVRFRGFKGLAAQADNADDIRVTARSVNRLLSMVHAPDEPMDVVRELGILFDQQARVGLLSEIGERFASGTGWEVGQLVRLCYSAQSRRRLDVADAVDRIRRAIENGKSPLREGEVARARLRVRLDQIEQGGNGSAAELVEDLRLAGVRTCTWDIILLLSQYIVAEAPDGERILYESGREGWLAGRGKVLAMTDNSRS